MPWELVWVIARYYGAKNKDYLQRAIHTTTAFGLVAGITLTAAGMYLAPKVLVLMGTPADVLPESIVYFQTYFAGSLGVVMYNIFVGILQSVGDGRHPLIYLIISSCVNVVLDIFFITGLGMGVGSAALATAISQFVSAILCMVHLMRVKEDYRLELRRIRFDRHMLRQIIQNGVPSGFQNSVIAIANVFVQSNINAFGKMAMAGCGAYSKVEGFAFLPVTCFTMAITTFVGQNFGAGKYHRMRKSVSVCMVMSMVSSAVMIILMYAFAPWIYRLFTTDSAVIVHGVHMSRFLLPSYFIYVIIGILSGALRGTGKVLVPMLLTCGGVCSLRILWLFYSRTDVSRN